MGHRRDRHRCRRWRSHAGHASLPSAISRLITRMTLHSVTRIGLGCRASQKPIQLRRAIRESDVTSALTLPEGAQTGGLAGAAARRRPAARPARPLARRARRRAGSHPPAHPRAPGAVARTEFETAALVARELAVAGLVAAAAAQGQRRASATSATGDRVIAFRADLDALPLQDTKDVPYRSTVENVAHACGHDVHTTVLLGLGLALAQLDRAGRAARPGPADLPAGRGVRAVRRARGDRGRRASRTSPRSSRCTATRSCRPAWSGCAPARSPRPRTPSRSR